MKEILITGCNGTIGQTLYNGLHGNYILSGADLPENDLTDYRQALTLTKNKDVVIHLAWDTVSENFGNGRYEPRNSLMFYNIYEAAYQNGVKRLIMLAQFTLKIFILSRLTASSDLLLTVFMEPTKYFSKSWAEFIPNLVLKSSA